MKTKIILYSIIAFLGLALVFAFKANTKESKITYCRILATQESLSTAMFGNKMDINFDLKG